MTTGTDSPVLPVLQISDAAVADLQLVLDGVRLPWRLLGGALGEPPGGSETAAVAVDLPGALVDSARSAGAVLLVDREQTPLARLNDLTFGGTAPSPTVADGGRVAGGRVVPERTREARLFADLTRTPAQVGPATGRRVVLVDRPPLAGELAGEPLLLVPVETATPDGVPAHVLVRATQAAVAEDAPGAQVVPVPLHWRDPPSDRALSAAVLRAYGGDPDEVGALGENRAPGGGSAWPDLLAALHAGADLPPVAGPGVRAVLERWRPPRHRRGLVVLLTGLSGSGKSTVARDLAEYVRSGTDRGVSLLDGDDVRRLLSAGLGFDRAARDLNVRRIGYLAAEIARHGGIAVCAPIAPYAASRAAVRQMVQPLGDFVLVHVSTPLAECERRDLKGLYAKARSGEIGEFTGVSDPYDVPLDADLAVDTSTRTRAQALADVVGYLTDGGWLGPRRTTCR